MKISFWVGVIMRRSIDFNTLDNSGNGYCGPYCIIQASDFVEFKSSSATYRLEMEVQNREYFKELVKQW